MCVHDLGLKPQRVLRYGVDALDKNRFALTLPMSSLVHREEVIPELAPLLRDMCEPPYVLSEAMNIKNHSFELGIHLMVIF